MRLIKLILLSLFVVGMAPVDAAAQGVSGRGISGNVSSQVNQACQVEVENLRDDIREVTNELDVLLNCNRQGKINIAGTTDCRDVVSPAHEWSDTTLAFAQERTGENTYRWAAGVDLKGDKGPKGESITCYSPGDAPPPPPPPPGNDNCSLPWGGTVAHGSSVTAYQASQAPACRSETRNCDDGNLSGSYQYQNCTPGGGGRGSRCCNHGIGWYECGRKCCHSNGGMTKPQHMLMICPSMTENCCPDNMEFLGHGQGGSDGYWGSKCRDRFGNVELYRCQ